MSQFFFLVCGPITRTVRRKGKKGKWAERRRNDL